MQWLANKYNVVIVRVYGAAGHGKDLIDAMSNFAIKSIDVGRDIIALDHWFANSLDISEYLTLRGIPLFHTMLLIVKYFIKLDVYVNQWL